MVSDWQLESAVRTVRTMAKNVEQLVAIANRMEKNRENLNSPLFVTQGMSRLEWPGWKSLLHVSIWGAFGLVFVYSVNQDLQKAKKSKSTQVERSTIDVHESPLAETQTGSLAERDQMSSQGENLNDQKDHRDIGLVIQLS